MTSRVRVNLRTFMLLVVAIALALWAVPPWCRWHHEMLKQSAFWSEVADSMDVAVGEDTRSAAAWHDLAQRLGGFRNPHAFGILFADECRWMASIYERNVAVYGKFARDLRRSATFPWVITDWPEDDPAYEVYPTGR